MLNKNLQIDTQLTERQPVTSELKFQLFPETNKTAVVTVLYKAQRHE